MRFVVASAFTFLVLTTSEFQANAEVKTDIVKEISKKPGKIRFDNRIKDFGQIERGEKAVHLFTFKNVGDGDLLIQGIHSSCGCTAIEMDQGKVYSPGEVGSLQVTFDSASFSGRVSKSLTVMTNQKSRSVRILTVRAQVKNSITVNPPLLDFGSLKSGTVSHRRVVVKGVQGNPLEVTGVDHDEKVDVQLTQKSDKEWLLDIYAKPTESGEFKEIVYLKTSLKDLPKVAIPVVGEIQGKIEHSPRYIEFGAVAENRTRKKTIKLDSLGEFKVIDAVVNMEINGKEVESGDYLSLDFSDKARSKHNMQLNLHNKDELAGSVYGDIELLTDDPDHKTIKLDFFAFFQD